MKELYFIAIIPGDEIREQVKLLKEEMRDRFGAKHALKSPAHITLQMPFRKEENEEDDIIRALELATEAISPFGVELNGFDCFSPRVLFVRVMNHEPVIRLHEHLKPCLKDKIGLEEKQIMNRIHPHMTIATRDLTEAAFYSAWPEFSSREFDASFTAKSIFLLKHNGKFWDIYREFPFGGRTD